MLVVERTDIGLDQNKIEGRYRSSQSLGLLRNTAKRLMATNEQPKERHNARTKLGRGFFFSWIH